jgi:hypothetical protein
MAFDSYGAVEVASIYKNNLKKKKYWSRVPDEFHTPR